MIDKLINDFEIIKGTLNTLPKNNERNKKKYLNFVKEVMDKYNHSQQKVLTEIKTRYDNINNFEENKDIVKKRDEIASFEKIKFLNPYKTSYSKMGLDKLLYNLDHFYKQNLDQVNDDICTCLELFKKVGIKKIDFNYSPYALEYINVLETEKDKKIIHKKFENIYWKCSDIILHIELNLKSIFLKNEKLIDKYYQKEIKNYLQNKTLEQVIKEHCYKKEELEKTIYNDKKFIVDNFIQGKINIKDFKNLNINSLYEKFKLKDVQNEIVYKNVLKLLYSLKELKGYLKYQYIIDDIKSKIKEKEKYKGQYEKKYKEIITLEKKLKKFNTKKIFGKRKDNISLIKINSVISELDEKYKDLETFRFNKLIYNLSEDKTLYDALLIAISNYNYLINVMKENNVDIEKIDQIINGIKEIIYNSHLTILNNISLVEEKNILFMISDRYALSSLNIEYDNLKNESDIDILLSDCYKILLFEKLKEKNLKIDDIEFIINVKKIFDC